MGSLNQNLKVLFGGGLEMLRKLVISRAADPNDEEQ